MISLKFKCKKNIIKLPLDLLQDINYFKTMLELCDNSENIIYMKIPWDSNVEKEEREKAVSDYFRWRCNYYNDKKLMDRIEEDELKKTEKATYDYIESFKNVIYVTHKKYFNIPEKYKDNVMAIIMAYCYFHYGKMYVNCRFLNRTYLKPLSSKAVYSSLHEIEQKIYYFLEKYQKGITHICNYIPLDKSYILNKGKILKNQRMINYPSNSIIKLADYFMDDIFKEEHNC